MTLINSVTRNDLGKTTFAAVLSLSFTLLTAANATWAAPLSMTTVLLGDPNIADDIDTTTVPGEIATDGSLSANLPGALSINAVPFSQSLDDFLTFNYSPLEQDKIISATLNLDITDSDGRLLTLSADSDGTVLGTTADSGDNASGGFGTWRAVNVHGDGTLTGMPNPGGFNGGNLDNLFNIPMSLFGDLADGTFVVDGVWAGNLTVGVFASNRAILTITSIPEPSSLMLTGGAAIFLVGRVRRRKRSA